MKILVVSSFYRPAYRYGGPVHSIHALSKALVGLGHQVTAYTTNANGPEPLDVPVGEAVDIEGVQVTYFLCDGPPVPWPLSMLGYFRRSVGYFRSRAMADALDRYAGEFDVLHLQGPFCYPARVAAGAARKAAVPYFYHARGVLQPSHLAHRAWKKRAYLRLCERPILRGATGLFALTDSEADAYRLLGLDNPVYVIPNGIDPADLACEVTDPADPLVASLGERDVVLYMGRLHPTKGVGLLVSAFCRVAAGHPNAVLVMAGPDEYGIRDELARTAAQAGAGDRVLFPGLVAGQAKRQLLARADIFALTSHGEGFSMAVLEGLGSGAAALLTKACHFDRVQEAGAGLVVDEDVEAVADALGRLLGDPASRRDMGRVGRDLVRDEYQWSRIAALTAEAYAEGIARVGHE